jgi:hypothetical protein
MSPNASAFYRHPANRPRFLDAVAERLLPPAMSRAAGPRPARQKMRGGPTDVPEPGASDGQPVFRLIYRSHSRIAAGDAKAELGEIFTTARRNNRALGITGALVTTKEDFAQTLEGSEAAVRDVFERIRQDARHEDVTVIETDTVPERIFGRWAMAQVSEGGGPDIRLVSNAAKRSIVVAGPESHVTPEQETVLARMRESIAREEHRG